MQSISLNILTKKQKEKIAAYIEYCKNILNDESALEIIPLLKKWWYIRFTLKNDVYGESSAGRLTSGTRTGAIVKIAPRIFRCNIIRKGIISFSWGFSLRIDSRVHLIFCIPASGD